MTNHEHLPDSNDPDRPGPEQEYLQPGDIDFTGAVPQRDDMLDLIGDAFTEANASGGELPDWGARAIARILADGLEPGSALHQFTVTGRADPDAISAETIPIYNAPDTPAEVKRWIDYLGTYLIHQDDDAETPTAPPTADISSERITSVDISGKPGEEVAVTAIREAVRLARDTGDLIPRWTAHAIARHLADKLPFQNSALNRYANTGVIRRLQLAVETRWIASAAETSDEIREWISYLDDFTTEHRIATMGQPGGASEPEPGSQAAEGIRQFGDAFRAYLALEDIDPDREDLIETFHEVYVGCFANMHEVIEGLTEITDWQAALDEVTARYGIDDLVSIDRPKVERMVRSTWSLKRVGGVIYVFDK